MVNKRIDNLYKQTGQNIRKHRNSRGLNQQALAEKCDLKRPSIALIESGSQRVPLDGLYKIAHALNCNPYDLLPDIESIFPKDKHIFDSASQSRVSEEERMQIDQVLKTLE